MALSLPNLDDRTYQSLMEEARALIPTYDPDWTNHNPTDPGITLIELFAWLAEMLIFRSNRVTDLNVIAFLKLLNGPEWTSGPVLDDDIRNSIVALRQHYRAVTLEDYEILTKEAAPDEIARTKCVPRRNLDAIAEVDRTKYQPGHVSIIIVPNAMDPAPQPSLPLLRKTSDHLEPRRLLTTRHHVVGPIYAPVSPDILIACQPDVTYVPTTPGRPSALERLRNRVVEALETFLHPLRGGPDGEGWPFGRGVYVSELYELLENIAGVDYTPDIGLSSHCTAEMTRCVAANELWHEEGDFIGLELKAHHLPMAQIDPGRIIVSAVFIPVHASLQVTPAGASSPAMVRRAVKNRVKHLFHPLHGESVDWMSLARTVDIADMMNEVRNLDEVDEVVKISLQSDPNRLVRNEFGDVDGVRIEAREIADVQVKLTFV